MGVTAIPISVDGVSESQLGEVTEDVIGATDEWKLPARTLQRRRDFAPGRTQTRRIGHESIV